MLTASPSSCYHDLMPLRTVPLLLLRDKGNRGGADPSEELVQLSRAKFRIAIYPRELPNSALLSGLALCSFFQGTWPTGQSPFLGERDSFLSMVPCHSCKNHHKFKRGKLLVRDLCKNVIFHRSGGDEVKTHPHSNLFLTTIG